MKRSLFLVAIVSLGLIGGCGTTGTTDDLPSFYTGAWAGLWEDRTRGDGGDMSLNIATDGTIAGACSRTSDGEPADIVGRVRNSGRFDATADFDVNPWTMTGTVTKSGDDLIVNFAYTANGITSTGTCTMTLGGGGGGS